MSLLRLSRFLKRKHVISSPVAGQLEFLVESGQFVAADQPIGRIISSFDAVITVKSPVNGKITSLIRQQNSERSQVEEDSDFMVIDDSLAVLQALSDKLKKGEFLDPVASERILVSSSGRNFKFSDREDAMLVLANSLSTRFHQWRHGELDKRYHPIPFIAMGQGMGKSRFLSELSHSFKKIIESSENYSEDFKQGISNAVYFNITFGNGMAYSSAEKKLPLEFSINYRILHLFFKDAYS
jgi:hypothetical protein